MESLSLKKDDIIFGKALEKLNILLERSGIKAYRRVHTLGLQVRNILEHTISTGSYMITLNEEKNFHVTSPLVRKGSSFPLHFFLGHDQNRFCEVDA
jgi:hypothetical protein